ncbi:MAG: glutamine-hydrolyzing GMP synthase [Lachnospiraceae bacterium]|jgi:GMP synthase (glutamine-hydrolysing)|nr:glutamine-hydrolyzing GMP synthase [Lachnospiraceae bacterium]
MNTETIIVLDFGGQYNQLIARRVRECHVYCEVRPYHTPLEEIRALRPKGIIFTGGPNSVYDPASPRCSEEIYDLGIPILGICYGAQLMAHQLGGRVTTAPVSEYGKTEVFVGNDPAIGGVQAGAAPGGLSARTVTAPSAATDQSAVGQTDDSAKLQGSGAYPADCRTGGLILRDITSPTVCWMSHTDYIETMPEGFARTAHTPVCPVAAMENASRKLYATQFHPEVAHTREGMKMLSHFVYDACGCKGDWQMASFVETTVAALKRKVGAGKVLCALSGGVDSSVAAVLLSKAVGKQLTCVFVDHGLLRKNEGDEVEAVFGPSGPYDLQFVRVDARGRFLQKLSGVTEPEAKRKIIGEEFIRVFEEESKKIGAVDFLVQGTIYPDVIESGLDKSAVIKSHHNVGGLPDYVDFKEIIEPLRMLFKDEVRKAGLELGIPARLVNRQPFPGPGLGIRIIGEVTAEKVALVQEADHIYREEIARAGLDSGLSQYFAALTNMRSVGVMGDGRTYDYAVVLRAVTTSDFMTAESAQIPWDTLSHIANRIVNEVKGVNRVLYDCTGKPPATIELE